MVRNNEGLTKTYNRFHDPDERSADILRAPRAARRDGPRRPRRLRLDRPAEPPPANSCSTTRRTTTRTSPPAGRRRKKPWRYRWPDDFRDEVLARLLELNRQRAEQERLSGLAAAEMNAKPTKPPGRSGTAKKHANHPTLPGM